MEPKKRVLVVDDEPGVLRFVQVSLSLAGYDVQTAADAREALELARSQPPDIVLTDIVMAPMDGFQLLDGLRAFSDVPVIVFTAQAIIADLALKIGADDFIAKPFRPGELEKKIKAVLEGRAAIQGKP
jgi:two-component system KDP operon response regulator KdpE